MESATMQPQAPRSRRLGRRGMLVATTLGLATGGFAGGYLVSHAATNGTSSSSSSTSSGSSGGAAATPSSGSSGSGSTSSGTFHSNEDPTHAAGESAAREAQENAGQMPTVP